MNTFEPDYRNILKVLYNQKPDYLKAALIWMSILVNIFLSGKKIPMMHSVMKLRFAKSFPVMGLY